MVHAHNGLKKRIYLSAHCGGPMLDNRNMLVLASASPRRRELLAQAGFAFDVIPADIPEEIFPGEEPVAYATRLAREKAETIYRWLSVKPDTGSKLAVLGADTIVTLDNRILGKPEDAADAARMLHMLAARTHTVITGVALITDTSNETAAEVTSVTFSPLSDEEIDNYIASGEPMDKAGAYGIQGQAARWIPRIEGCYFNVVGLPIARVTAMLKSAKVISGM
jgi:septum formation protein